MSPGPFADKFGFTEEDVQRILVDFAQESASEGMRAWYNGYNFGGVTIYNPWSVSQSVNRFPAPPGPQWLNTASNQLVYAELERGGMELKRDLEKLLAGEELRYPILDTITFEDIGRNPVEYLEFPVLCRLSEGGRPRVSSAEFDDPHLCHQIPNIEVSLVYQQFIARFFEEQIQWRRYGGAALVTRPY